MRLVGILEDVDRGSRRESLEAQVASFPGAPGVYLFKDGKGRVLYVGKADVLRDRVRAYFGPTLDVRHVLNLGLHTHEKALPMRPQA